MVNAGFTPFGVVTSPGDRDAAERRVILSYAPVQARPALEALFAVDDSMASILRTTSQPMVGQMRLTWWHGALAALDEAPPPAQPVLEAAALHLVPRVGGAALSAIVEGWEELLNPDALGDAALGDYAARRGAGLFGIAAAVLGGPGDAPIELAGRGWALADLAAHTADPELAGRARRLAEPGLDIAARYRWPRRLRPLGALAHLARRHDASEARRIGRALWHRLTGF